MQLYRFSFYKGLNTLSNLALAVLGAKLKKMYNQFLISCVKTRSFKKSLKKYPFLIKEVNELIRMIQDDPTIGSMFTMPGYKGIRHAKHPRLGKNYSIYYAVCDEACEVRNGQQCPWCKELTCKSDGHGKIVLLYFGTHKITDRIMKNSHAIQKRKANDG